MKIINSFLPEKFNKEMNDTFLSNRFPWYYTNETTALSPDTVRDSNTLECPLYIHGFVFNDHIYSDYYSLVKPILYFVDGMDDYKIHRMKINMMYKCADYPEGFHNTIHSDVDKNQFNECKTLLYYVNDSDGDTFLFDKHLGDNITSLNISHRISPKRNTLIIFDSNLLHASSPPKLNNNRLTLNIVLYKS